MYEILYDPWLVAVASQVIGGVISGLIVYYLTQNRSGLTDDDIRKLFPPHIRVNVPTRTPLSLLLNWRYFIFYIILFSGIAGLTLLQNPISINWLQVFVYVILVTWWSMVALNVFVLMDGAVLYGHLPNPLLLFVAIIFPLIGHTKAVVYTLFAFITKFGLGILLYGVLLRFYRVDTHFIISVLLMGFALVDAVFYAYLFLTRYPEFYNWREGKFIVNKLDWAK